MNNNEKQRCGWCFDNPLYAKYHDTEWGVPVYDDHKLFEFLILEGAQAGLSWITVLKKRENYRRLYDNFDPTIVANYNHDKKLELMNDSGIIRNKLKIDGSISNASAFLKVQKEFGSFDTYIWSFVDHVQIQNSFDTMEQIPAKTQLSETISKDLKKRGFKFIGPTIIYAFMQAIGMVNDHVIGCFRYSLVKKSRDKICDINDK
ncbi:MAG: DNA-3-methyladenine glycosylase I [Candidatus Midichloriaceae bacterium]|jgi:DNA-3-methyladenine glycosylase I